MNQQVLWGDAPLCWQEVVQVARGQAQLALDLRATEIQHYCFTARTARKGHADYYESPAFHPE